MKCPHCSHEWKFEKQGRPAKIGRGEVLSLAGQGMSAAKIAEALSCSKAAVYKILKGLRACDKKTVAAG
jgi:DNA invertase Pin-like site-specific DNA recombinase